MFIFPVWQAASTPRAALFARLSLCIFGVLAFRVPAGGDKPRPYERQGEALRRARFLEEEIERWLGIEDRPVRGELER